MLLSFALSSCSRVKIKNHEWCADLGDMGADCFQTLSDEKRYPEKEQWDKERFGMLCTSSDTFADMKEIILKLCQVSKKCDYATRQAIAHFFYKADKSQFMVKVLE